jgi:hypothetical protein
LSRTERQPTIELNANFKVHPSRTTWVKEPIYVLNRDLLSLASTSHPWIESFSLTFHLQSILSPFLLDLLYFIVNELLSALLANVY